MKNRPYEGAPQRLGPKSPQSRSQNSDGQPMPFRELPIPNLWDQSGPVR